MIFPGAAAEPSGRTSRERPRPVTTEEIMRLPTRWVGLVALSGCALIAPPVPQEPITTSATVLRTYIPPEEIARSRANDAYDLVSERRPSWLVHKWGNRYVDRGDIVVYVNRVRMGGPSALHDVAILDVYAVTMYDPSQANLRFGRSHPFGAINVQTVPDPAELLPAPDAARHHHPSPS
jgi:hypothetical protein